MLLHHRLGRALVGAAVAAAFVIAVASPLSAQTTSASVAGSVKDAQSAVLPGATVTLTSVAQGTELNAVSDELGNFLFPYVRPDTYTLTITLAGLPDGQEGERDRQRQRPADGRRLHADDRPAQRDASWSRARRTTSS